MKIFAPILGCYICLKGIKHGNKFMTTWQPNHDFTHLHDGTLAYEIIGYATTHEAAMRILYPTQEEEDRAYNKFVTEAYLKSQGLLPID